MVQHQEDVRIESQFGVGTSVIVAELDLVRTVVELLHDRTHLSADESVLRQVHEESDDVEDADGDRTAHGEAQRR